MTVNSSSGINNCAKCQTDTTNDRFRFRHNKCGHVVHGHCWAAECLPCKELRTDLISIENWTAVGTTVAIGLLASLVFSLKK